jgi:hypothetical protein
MADVVTKQQTTILFLSTVVTHTHTHKETQRTDKEMTNVMGNLCCSKEHSIHFFVQFFTQLNYTV